MSRIVLTTDLSDESRRAFAPARDLAQKLGLEITLLAVVEDVPFEPMGGGLVAAMPVRERLHSDWSQRITALAKELGPTTRTEVLDAADVPRAICEYARSQNASYIAMATHGRTGLRRLLLGSVAEAVLRHATVPVIVFPPPAK
jgi:nucleotide-binding universal stress UspA family protein